MLSLHRGSIIHYINLNGNSVYDNKKELFSLKQTNKFLCQRRKFTLTENFDLLCYGRVVGRSFWSGNCVRSPRVGQINTSYRLLDTGATLLCVPWRRLRRCRVDSTRYI